MTPLYPPARPLPISQVLDLAVRMFKASFVRCLAFGPTCMIVGQLPNIYWLILGRPKQAFGGNAPLWWELYAIGLIGTLVLSAALILHQRDIVSGVPTRAFAQVAAAARRVLSLIALLVVSLLLISAPIGVVVSVFMQNPTLAPGSPAIAAGVVALIGLTYISLALAVVWSAYLIDRMAPIAAVRYGFKLVHGQWWRVCAIFTVALIVTTVIYFAIGAIAVPLAGAMDLATLTAVTEMMIVGVSALVAPYFGATSLAIYGDLKARKEGTDLEQRIVAAARA